jgi:uncharacterized protein (TIGR02099 family)
MLRAILSTRHILSRFLASHAGSIAGRGLLLLATMLYFSFAIAVIALRYWVLPGIESYRPDIEQAVSFGLGRRVTIDSVEADWHGLNPYLALHKVAIYDESNRPALELGLVESTLSWSSLWHLELRQHSLDIWRPSLTIRRDHSGQVFVAGIALAKSDSGDGRVADWLLAQRNIAIRDADLVWIDEQRAAPPLALAHVEFLLENSGSRHRFALRAQPPREHASALELRGDLNGDSANDLAQWRGQIYANLDYADLAVWRAWIDYPIDLSQGRGGLRLWAEFRAQQLRGLTADVGLADVIARLGPQLAPLELRRLQGRFQLSYADTGYTVAGTGVNFRTSAGIGMEPADFSVRLSHPPAGDSGEIRANALDLHELALLADYLPLDAALQATLAKYAPQGKVYGLRFNWSGPLNQPQSYALQSRFTGLGVNPGEVTPGFSGLTGNIDASEAKGTLALDSQHAAVELPVLFEDPHVTFDTLSAGVSWRHTASEYAFEIGSLAFANADAAGSASGSYQTVAGGPGVIDVGARLTRAEVRQVARYLPLRVHENVRVWLARALLAGTSQDVRLKLKGDLSRFPFADDADGVFQIVAKVQGGKLNYGDAWPVIDNVVAEVVFQSRRLEVNAAQGSILGTRLGHTRVEIPDLANKQEKWLNVAGSAEGPTAEFLRFIELSPVARITDDVTLDMRAAGNGKLALKVNLPLPTLNHPVPLAKPRVSGSFQFASNQLTFVPSLPPITQFNGRLDFTESGLTARSLSGNFLGGATTLSAVTRPDTGVTVLWQGAAGIEALQRTLDYPWLKKLSGSTAWRTTIAVRRRAVDIAFDSSLAGIGSELPDPLKKAAPETMPLHIERKIAAADGTREAGAVRIENWQLTLGKSVAAQWVVQTGASGSELARASLAFNEAAQLPARGITVSGRLPVLDFDQLRELAPAAGGAERSDGARVNLKLGALDALGRRLNDVDFRSEFKDGTWQTSVQAKEMEGRIDWQPKGQGRVVARLKQFTLPDASPAAQALARRAETAPAAREEKRSGDLPELDLVADSFVVHDKQLGKLELTASNAARDWNIEKMLLSNPDGSMRADGVWQNYAVQPHINLNLHLESGDIGKLLSRLGFPGTMRRGQATLDGKLAWLGNPQSIDYPSLSGNLKLDAKQGQFSKIEPGIGKLLGILSLQSLPRRLTLDFNDVFSEGFAFDQITGNVDIARGVMSTKDLKIDGPAAKVQISGSTNLVNETQDLRVKVLPTVGEGVSLLGAFLINPIVGITSLVAQKVFKDPLSQFLAYEYAVTGSWGDPKVEKTRGPQALPAIGQGTPQTNPPAPLPLAGPSAPALPPASKP